MSTPRQIAAARLNGTATRWAALMKDDEAPAGAVAELRSISTDPALLGEVAGVFWAEAGDPVRPFAGRALSLLVLAGADRGTAVAVRDARLARGPAGLGHSTP